MKRAAHAAFLVLLAFPAAAACVPQRPSHIGNTQGYSAEYGDKCFVSIHPMNALDLIYRDYTFFNSGLLMVFSSYGPGEDIGRLTSAREYYLFPRLDAPRLEMDPAAGAVSVIASDGRRFSFDPATAQVAALDGDVTVDPLVDPSVRGGVAITRYAGLLLDAGYRQGGQPTGRRNGDSTFRSPHGQLCAVKNSEIFEYTPDGEHRLKLDDAALKAWLATRCPALPVGY